MNFSKKLPFETNYSLSPDSQESHLSVCIGQCGATGSLQLFVIKRDCVGFQNTFISVLPNQRLQKTLKYLHFHRPVEMLLGVAVHFLRVVGVGADLLRERQDVVNIDGAFVGGEMEDVREVCREVRISTCNDIRDPPGTILTALQFGCLRQPLPMNPKAPYRDMTLVKEIIEGFAGREAVEDHPVADAEFLGQLLEVG